MRADDIDDAEALSSDSFHALAMTNRLADEPLPTRRDEAHSVVWREQAAHLLEHDSPGCWVAEDDGLLIGAATSLRRETLWALSTFGVRPGVQGHGVGKALLEAALTYSQGCVRGMICSSYDPKALRRYHGAGFTLHPTMAVKGTVDRSVLPVVEYVRPGTEGDIDLLESADRFTRGAGHAVDHLFMARRFGLLVSDSHLGSGYCYVFRTGGVYLLAATGRRVAQQLVWEAMARSESGSFTVGGFTAEQDWLIDVAMTARLELHRDSYLALRFVKPPKTYVASPHFL